MSKMVKLNTTIRPKTLTESYNFQFWWKNSEEQLNGLIRCRGLYFDGSSPFYTEKKQNIFVQISGTVLCGYFGAKRTVFGFLSITLANSFTGPYIIQPA